MSSTSRFFAVAADGSVSPIAASRILWRDSRGEELTIDAMPWALSLQCGLDHRQGTVAMLSILPMAGNCVTVMVQREPGVVAEEAPASRSAGRKAMARRRQRAR